MKIKGYFFILLFLLLFSLNSSFAQDIKYSLNAGYFFSPAKSFYGLIYRVDYDTEPYEDVIFGSDFDTYDRFDLG